MTYRELPSGRQLEVLGYIAHETEKHGYPPTVRELGRLMGIRSTNGIVDHLLRLEVKGYIVRDGRKARALTVTQAGHEAIKSWKSRTRRGGTP